VGVEGGGRWRTDGTAEVAVTLRNDADRDASEVVQIYLHDPVAEVTRPVQQLIAAQRVDLAPGEQRRLTFALHADLTAFTGRAGRRIVDPGAVELRVGASSADVRATLGFTLSGPRREVGFDRVLAPRVSWVSAA
jgi:beta-glucosidase